MVKWLNYWVCINADAFLKDIFRHDINQSINPLLRSHCTCGSLYLHITSALSGSISHGTIITTLPG